MTKNTKPVRKDKKTHLVLLIDKSGSMSSLAVTVIMSVNDLLKKQFNEQQEDTLIVTLILFDSAVTVLYAGVEPTKKNLKSLFLTPTVYVPRGMTALLDAIGTGIEMADNFTTGLPEKTKTIFAIMTDGNENASQQFSLDAIRQLLESRSSKNWQLLFMGAGIDAFAEARKIGIDREYTITVAHNNDNIKQVLESTSANIAEYRASGKAESLRYSADQRKNAITRDLPVAPRYRKKR